VPVQNIVLQKIFFSLDKWFLILLLLSCKSESHEPVFKHQSVVASHGKMPFRVLDFLIFLLPM